MKVVRTNEVPWVEQMNKGNFHNRRKELGGEKLSCGLWELPPGKKSFPYHAHSVTEEAMFVVSGRAKVRTSDGEVAIGPGDYVSFPAGGTPHQLINEHSEPMVYLAMSATQGFDMVEYPDSQKIGVAFGKPGAGKRFIFKLDSQAGYFDGEKDAG